MVENGWKTGDLRGLPAVGREVVSNQNKTKGRGILSFGGIIVISEDKNYQVQWFVGMPLTFGLAINTLPLSGYRSKSSSLKFSLAVVMRSISQSSPTNAQDVTFGAGTVILSRSSPVLGFQR